MNFQEAIQAMKDGKYVTRADWTPEQGYLALMGGMNHVWHITITPTINAGNKLFSVEDFCAEDWQVSNGCNSEIAEEECEEEYENEDAA